MLAVALGLFCVGGTAATATAQDGKSTTSKKLKAKYEKVFESLKEKDYDAAKEVLDEILEADPNQADAWALTARVHNAQKDYKNAAKAAKKAVKLNDDHAFAWGELSFALVMQKKYAEAIPALEKTIELNPTLWPAYDALVVCYREEGMDDEAAALAKKKKKMMDKENAKKPAPKDDDQ
jgi:Tfp pilus assembly protein PilF